jgi:uncharacterized protein
MCQPNVAAASAYALARLARELPPALCYHSIGHTRDDVLPALEYLAATIGVGGEDLLLLRTAAYYHDLGFVERYDDHEIASAQIARAVLPQFGYHAGQIRRILAMIMATRLPQSPGTLLEQILADADLDVLGRDDYLPLSQLLRDELHHTGFVVADGDWYRGQIAFLRDHHYWTAAARARRDEQKQRNIALLHHMLAASQSALQ